MSSDDSDPEPPKRKLRRIEDSPSPSSSSGSPVISSARARVRSQERNPIHSSDSESGSPIISSNLRRRLARLPSNTESASSGSPPIRRNVSRPRRLPSLSESEQSDSPTIRRQLRPRRLPSFSDNASELSDNGFQGSSQWETDFSDNEIAATEQNTSKTITDTNIDSDSSDGQSEKCPICLVSFKKQQIGTPESCDHVFCLDCIMEWSKNVNTCPVDRQEYRLILVREHLKGKMINQIPVEKPVPEQDMLIEDDPTHCEICGSTDDEDRMLLCDGCDLGFHLYCLTPPLDAVPVGYWYCNDCDGPMSEGEIDMAEIDFLIDDADDYAQRPTTRTRNLTARLIPRTGHSERVRRRVVNNRRQQTSSSLTRNSEIISSSTSTSRRRRRTRRRTNVSSETRYRTVYVIDEVTGETVGIRTRVKSKKSRGRRRRKRRERTTSRPATAKNRIARQLSMSTSGCSSQNSSTASAPGSIDGLRHQAGIPTLHLFGQNNQLDYFSGEDEDYEVGGQLLARRAPTHSDVAVLRRAARRKAVLNVTNNVSSSTDLLDSILSSQQQFHSKNASYSLDSDGKFKIENKDKKYVDVTKQETSAKQTPYNPNRNNYYNNRYNNYNNYSGNNYNNRRQNNYYNNSNNQNYYNSTPSSSMQYSNYNQRGGSRYEDNDYPQDYTQRTLCASSDINPQDRRDNREEENAGNSQHSESEVDIYSDIETVTTSRPEDSDLKPPPTPPEFPSELMGDDEDSEHDMVIDEKNQEVAEEAAVSSTVGYMSFPFPPPNFPPPLSLPPIPPSLDFPDEEPLEFSIEPHSHLSSNDEPHLRFSTAPSINTRPSYSTADSSMEIQSGAVQSSAIPQRKLIPYDDDEDENSGDGCPNSNIYSKQNTNVSNDIDEDSNDGCPNFSIYSKESKNVALHTDISIPSMGSLQLHQNYQVGEISSSPNLADIPPPPSDDGNDMYNPEEETDLCEDQLDEPMQGDQYDDKKEEEQEEIQDDHNKQEEEPNVSVEEEEEAEKSGEIAEEEEERQENLGCYEVENDQKIQDDDVWDDEDKENTDQSVEHKDQSGEDVEPEEQHNEKEDYSLEEQLEHMQEEPDEENDKLDEDVEPPPPKELSSSASTNNENEGNLSKEPEEDTTTNEPEEKEDAEETEFRKANSQSPEPKNKKTILKGGVTGGLYSDSEDESLVKKTDGNEITFGISDINDMTEDISEEERSYTPCLDEKRQRQGIEGLDTEMISDDDRNDFDESHEMKTVDDGDALEINAKESEMDFTRPEDYEEGEIIDKNKEKEAEEEVEREEPETGIEPEPEQIKEVAEKPKKDDDKSEKKTKKKSKEKGRDKSADKENDGNKEPFKKLSRSNKERNYRGDKDKEKGGSPLRSKEKSAKEKEKDRKKEKRKELERYNVRALIAEKPRPLIAKDQFGRDIRQTPSRSRSRSYTPPPRRSETPRLGEAAPRHRSVSKDPRSASRPHRSRSRSRQSLSRRHTSVPKERSRKRRRSRNQRSRSPKKRPSSKNKKRKRSATRFKRKSRERDRERGVRRKKKRVSSRSRRRSRSDERRAREWEMVEWSPPSMALPDELPQAGSPSWTPPRLLDNAQALRGENLTVTLNNTSKRKRDKRKGDRRNKENLESRRRRRVIDRDRTPPPSKEVFASGDNILVSVSFNNENEVRDVTTRDRRKVEESRKRKERRRRNRQDLSGVKPVAIIDLARSPFREITSPKAIIVLTDSDNERDNDNEHGVEENICDSSQQVASPERSMNYSTGPKTPPEPQVKFTLTSKTPQVRAINNPLHEPDDIETNDIHEELESRLNENMHNGPSTPPDPPNSPPSSPDAYDPFEPTKSRSPTPEPSEKLQSSAGNDDHIESRIDSLSVIDLEKAINPSAEVNKSMTPPLLDIQPADSQSSIQATPENNQLASPEIIVGVNPSQPTSTSKPVAQTTPFSSVPTSLITSTPISSNLAPSRINILNSTIIPAPASSIPQRIVLPNQVKSSPVKISPTKATIKSTPIKPMPTKNVKLSTKKRQSQNNSSSLDEIVLDFDSPYSPGSSDYEDLFEPPSEIVTKPLIKNKTKSPAKHLSAFDNLFGSPSYKPSVKPKSDKSKKKTVALSRTKTVGVKLDEDNLKILDELPNSAVEMLVKDKFLKKLNRLERVVEEVKHVLKPHYNKKRITKEEYKDIMRRSVPKICHNKSGEINPTKIQKLVEAYVRKIKHNKKVTSSSSVNPQKV